MKDTHNCLQNPEYLRKHRDSDFKDTDSFLKDADKKEVSPNR
jgi:hypothetical protein